MSSSSSTGQAELAVANTATRLQNVVTPTTSWTQISQPFTVGPDGYMRVHLYELAGSETAYWDHVSITPLPPANAGFESGSLGPWQGWKITVGSTAHSGSYGLTEAPTTSNDVAFQDIYGLIPGQTYLVSAWVKSSTAWDSLWQEMGVGEQNWLDWQNAVQAARQDIPVLPDFPQISKLAYIDEGTVHLDARELHDECVRMSSLLTSEETQQIVRSLLEASNSALQNNDADVVVHPYPA
jgi:hypothetical protein